MSAVSLVTYDVKPGRMDEFLANMREAKEVIEGVAVNLQSIRAFNSAIAGPNTGRVHVEFLYGDVTDWGETFVREANDPGFNALLARAMGPDAPATFVARGIQTEIGPSAGSETGSVMLGAVGRVKPGRMDAYRSHLDGINECLLSHGVERVRHLMMAVAGPMSGAVITLSEYRDMVAFGESWASRNNDPAWQEIIDAVVGADGPVTPISLVILTELPL